MGGIFDILGPVMVGPSSSHTAGAVRIGLVSRKLLGRRPVRAEIYFHGSFAATGEGHGTDRGIVAGLLGMKPNDMRIPESFQIAEKEGMEVHIEKREIRDAHPNTAFLVLKAEDGQPLKIQACSIGGGRILVTKLNGMDVKFSAEMNTLIVYNLDQPGCVADVAHVLSRKKINIATMQLFRDKRGGYAVMVVETDQIISRQALEWLESMEGILKVAFIDTNQ